MEKRELQNRTEQFALRIINLVSKLPTSPVAKVIGGQVLRSGTSIGANYIEACHARSHADFAAKIKICEAEEGETMYWLRRLIQSGSVPEAKLSDLCEEARQITAIMSSSAKTSRTVRSLSN